MSGTQTIDDRFVIEAKAASGGMGTVYRGRELATGALVAIKVLHRSSAIDHERFVREVRILAGLSHPGIARYVAHGVLAGGAPYLVMDWVPGETLDMRLHGVGLSIADSVTVARRVAAALAFAHAHGVVHRDIKPSNLIFPDGDLARTTVLDFGVARAITAAASLTETGSVVGTPSYMAPEQVRGARDVGPAADVFSLGCVLYECLTGRLTFEGVRFLALRAKILLWDPPPARELSPDIPAELDALVRRMLAKHAVDRPPDAGALVALLDALPPIDPGATTPRARHADLPTDIGPRPHLPAYAAAPPRLLSIVVATTPEGADGDLAPTASYDNLSPLEVSLESALRPFDAELEVLPDGALVVMLWSAPDGTDQARRAAMCALAIRRALPAALIGVATCEARARDEAEAIEHAVQALAMDAITLVFTGVGAATLPPGAIQVDARTAALIEHDFELVRIDGSAYLRGDARPHGLSER